MVNDVRGPVCPIKANHLTLPTTGALAASAFLIGAAATTSAHRILYDNATGLLAYDSDGNGAAAAIAVATITSGLALTSSQFTVT